jgi:hypothetical protein
MLAVRPGVGCIPAPPGTIPAIFGIRPWLIGLEVPGARPACRGEQRGVEMPKQKESGDAFLAGLARLKNQLI